MKTITPTLALFMLTACSATSPATPQAAFVENLRALCGQSYLGSVVSNDAVDADWKKSEIEAGPIACGDAEIRMPLRVGDDRSRTWVLTPTAQSITLKHDHRHKDGTPDAVTQYGGTTADAGTSTRQSFPVDSYSVEMFKREGLTASVTNTWNMEITPGQRLAYELTRPPVDGAKQGRFFRVEFPLN